MIQHSETGRRLLVVGDRVLVKFEVGEEKTKNGLILPQSVQERQQVASGRVVEVGPGLPMPLGDGESEEPWQENTQVQPRYLPMQVKVGDLAIFLRKAAIEMQFDGEDYWIVGQSAILVLLRDDDEVLHHG